MERVVVYEKRTCTTCRSLVQLLQSKGIDFDRIDYTIDPVPRAKLQELIGKMGVSARDLLRTKEAAYRELGLSDQGLNEDTILDALAAHPELLQRPIVEIGKRAVLARPPERVQEIL